MAVNTLSDSDKIFSEFPEDIIHKILSCVTLKQRPTVSLVSKKWRQTIKSLDENLNLVQTHFKKIACGYCSSSHLYPHASCVCSDTDLYHVDPFIKLAADNISFKELYLFIPLNFRYCASLEILDSRFLTVLHIKGNCNMNIIREFDVMPSLKELYLHSVCIFSRTFSNFIPKCPYLVELTLINCDNLIDFTVPHLNYLVKLHVNSRKKIKKLEIKAQNLLEFHLCSSAFTKIDLSASTKLQILHIDSTYVPDSFPHDICSTFPSLKSLYLQLCRGLKKIKIVSPQLECLTLNNIIDLDKAFIVTPNLQLFNVIYSFKFQTPYPVVGSRLMKVEMGARATNSLLELRTFAENLGENITLSLETDTIGAKEEVTFQSNLQPLCIKRINLVLQSSLKPRYESFLAEFFGYFHPRTLVVTVNSDARKHDFIPRRYQTPNVTNVVSTCLGTVHLKSFTVLGSTAFARQERESQCDKSTLCVGLGEGSSQKGLSVDLPNISTITRQEREARCDKPTLCAGSEKGSSQKGLLVDLPNIPTITSQEREAWYGKRWLCAGSEEGREQQCILFIALPNLSTITRQCAHQINLEFEW
ncbi:hypothetical protein R3W88_014074 [Solanum pinnatisectum]|uniref:F-box domain-containing protein n=1 Tax=Solanum pinnatisectum TaxID=50273 RepID=A0AAV9KQJ2_9SOLN|nr:hypothetical protein R3W88_014074 [Solanum pinnatisectum]